MPRTRGDGGQAPAPAPGLTAAGRDLVWRGDDDAQEGARALRLPAHQRLLLLNVHAQHEPRVELAAVLASQQRLAVGGAGV